MKFNWVRALKVKDSRNKATIKVIVNVNGKELFAIAPNGTSRGFKEVRDFSWKGIDWSIELINKIGNQILNLKLETFEDLEKIEEVARKIDKTWNWKIIGGNAIYALEAALLKAIAFTNEKEVWEFLLKEQKQKIQMPLPIGNCMGGGKHTLLKIKPEFQEFLLIPKAKRFFEAYFVMQQAYKKSKELLEKTKKLKGVNLENALIGEFGNEDALNFLVEVKETIRENFDIKLELGLDIAANSFFKDRVYWYKEKKLPTSRQLEYVLNLINKYDLFYVEDPFNESDFESFAELKIKAKKCLIVGDDLTCTNPEFIQKAISLNSVSGVIIKPNQIGSLIKTKKAIDLAKRNGIKCIISHRSGETVDPFIADLAVGWQIPFIKAGIKGKEREAKLRRLVEIEKKL